MAATISVPTARHVLWLAACFALPVPIWLLGPGAVPPVQLAELGLAAVAFGVAEGFRGVVGWTVLIFLGQALVYVALLWLLAAGLARWLGRWRGLALALALVGVAVACAVPIYRTPYHAQLADATLLQVYR